MSNYVLGLDIGTSTVKAILIEKGGGIAGESSERLGSQHAEVEVEGGRERRVSEVWSCLETCLVALEASKLKCVHAIGICGQMHGCVLWNDKLQGVQSPLTPGSCSNLITCQDGRCSPEFLSSLPTTRQPVPPSTGYGCATLAWLQHHRPGDLEPFNRAGTIMDLVVWRLCLLEERLVLMSAQNAASWGYFDINSLQWEKDILKGADFPVHLLPQVTHAPSFAGTLRTCWHHIPTGTPVGVAMGDLQCAVLATNPSPDDAVLNIGTASQLTVIKSASSQVQLPASVMVVPYFDTDQLIVAASLSGGNVFATLVETVRGWMEDLGVDRHSIPSNSELYERMVHLAEAKLDTSQSLPSVQVNLLGERHAPTLTGGVSNIKPGNLSIGDVCSAMFRGMIENLHSMMPNDQLQQVERLLGSGSAFHRNPVLQHHAKDIFSPRKLVMRPKADAPLGAALAVQQLKSKQN